MLNFAAAETEFSYLLITTGFDDRLSATTVGNTNKIKKTKEKKKEAIILTQSHPRTVQTHVRPTDRQLPPVGFNKAETEEPQCGRTHSCIGPNVAPYSY